MLGYIQRALKDFQQKAHKNDKTHSTYMRPCTMYDRKTQVMDYTYELKYLGTSGNHFIQQETGNVLYLGRAIDGNIPSTTLSHSIKAELSKIRYNK